MITITIILGVAVFVLAIVATNLYAEKLNVETERDNYQAKWAYERSSLEVCESKYGILQNEYVKLKNEFEQSKQNFNTVIESIDCTANELAKHTKTTNAEYAKKLKSLISNYSNVVK